MKTQICIVTGQPLANLIPILHFKPEKIFLVVTPFMKNKVQSFQELLKELNFVQEILVLDDCPDTNLSHINAFLAEKLANQLPLEPCIFNLTGGTKMHSFSMYEAFKEREYADKFIYVDTQNRLLEYYPKQNELFQNEPLPVVLDAKHTLMGMGKVFSKAASEEKTWVSEVQQRKELTYLIAQNIVDKDVKNLIGSLNTIVSKLYNGGKDSPRENKRDKLHEKPEGQAYKILEQAHSNNLVIWHKETQNIEFRNYKHARYLSGEWLEEYVWLVAQEIGFEEMYSGLHFTDKSKQAPNEIDLFIQHQNVALAIECKSATGVRNADNGQNMFHKLSGVASRAGGLMCSKLFVSAFALKNRDGRDSQSLLYAKDHHIKLVQAEEMVDELPQILQKWKVTGQL